MAILWCGGEDIDFPNGAAPTVDTTAGYFRAGYARCALGTTLTLNALAQSCVFPGGGVTSAWVSARFYLKGGLNSTWSGLKNIGVADSAGGTGGRNGVYVGQNNATPGKLCLFKYDGSSTTL